MYSLPWIQALFQSLHGAQKKTMAVFVDALLTCHDVRLAEIARTAGFQTGNSMAMALKRLWRFLRNPRFCDDTIVTGLAQWIWPRMASWRWIPISIDWTHNERRHLWMTLAASVAIGGRGITLMMRSYRKEDYDDHLSRNRCEEAFIKDMLRLLPKDRRIVLLADRGFARTELFRWLQELSVSYVIRVSRTVKVDSKRFSGLLSNLHLENGEGYSLGETVYRDDDPVTLTQLVAVREQQFDKEPDPWILATNLAHGAATIAKLYAKRMIIEQDFREAKSRLDWSDSRIRKVSHYRRMTTLMTVVLAFSTLVGGVVKRRPTEARKVARRRKGSWDHGVTAMGLHTLANSLAALRFLHQVKFPPQPI